MDARSLRNRLLLLLPLLLAAAEAWPSYWGVDPASVGRGDAFNKMGIAAFDAGDAAAMQKARAKFIVALARPVEQLREHAVAVGRVEGDELHDAGGGGHLLQRSDAEALAKELSRIANAPAMALYAEIKQRLTGFAGRVRAAAPALPDAL